MIIEIDFYYLEDSNFYKVFSSLEIPDKLKFNYISQSETDNLKNLKNKIIFFEEESFITSLYFYNKIINCYNSKPITIIISNNTDVYNSVQWMRGGASDYLIKNDLNVEILINSLRGSIDYNKKSNLQFEDDKITKKNLKNLPVIIPRSVNWKELVDNSNYNFAIVLFDINFNKESYTRYSKEFIDNIYSSFINEANKISSIFGGKLWYFGNNCGSLIFYFEDYINCAVLTSINIYNNFFLICHETLKLTELPDLKIIVHSGDGVFNSKNTDQITSDLVNSASHLIRQFAKVNTLNITEDVYSSLNPRIIKNFNRIDVYEKRNIYEYKFFNYS